MGGFYGVTFVRTGDRKPVQSLLKKLCGKEKARCLIGPVLRGWLGIYPQHHGQDGGIAAVLADAIREDMLHVMVHDDDFFCYFLYQGGALVDQYNSRPDYFDEVSAQVRKEMAGQPECLAHFLASGDDLPRLRQLLASARQNPPTFASETLQAFADLLHLPNAVTSYEYLMQGETNGIEAWDEFVHIPERRKAEAKKKAVVAGLEANKRRLRDEGILLVERPTKYALWWADRAGQGFDTAWSEKPDTLSHHAPPWQDAETTEIPKGCTVLGVSPSGRYLALSRVFEGQQILVFDRETNAVQSMRLKVPGGHAAFSMDEKQFVLVSMQEVWLVFLESKERPRKFPVIGTAQPAWHPSGWFVLMECQNNLAILDPESGNVRTLCVGKRHNAHSWNQAAEQAKPDEAAAMDKLEKDFRHRLKKLKLSEDQVAKMLQEWRSTVAQIQKRQPPATPRPIPSWGTEKPMTMTFDPEGARLFCGTSNGVRVYDWREVLNADQVMPSPIHAADTNPCEAKAAFGATSFPGYVYALAHDVETGLLLFGGLNGTIDYLNLNDGLSGTLVDIPGKPACSSWSSAAIDPPCCRLPSMAISKSARSPSRFSCRSGITEGLLSAWRSGMVDSP